MFCGVSAMLCLFLMTWIAILHLTSAQSQLLGISKGIKGGEATLVCIFPEAASPTISWIKRSGGQQIHVATFLSSGNAPQFSETVRDRASFNGGNLTITQLLLSDEGNYTCNVIAVELGAPLIKSTMLKVTAVPSVIASAVSSPIIGENGTYVASICSANFGKPPASIRWLNRAGVVQQSVSQQTQNEDGSWNVTAELILNPGLLGRTANSTHPPLPSEKAQEFSCDVEHNDLIAIKQSRENVTVRLLFSPFSHITILGNRLTCLAEGNPQPNLQWFTPNGQVEEQQNTLYLGQNEENNGLYSCLATNGIKPDSLSTVDVQKSKDLPVLFRTLVKLNTSLPTTASGYEIICSADINGAQNTTSNFLQFVWMKNGENIVGNPYQIATATELVNAARTRLTSSLKFVDIVRDRDDATFQCRFVNTTTITGFVTAVERSVSVSVDYPPSSVVVSGEPPGFTVEEGKPLSLTCSADSKPFSTFQWYLRETLLQSGDTLTIANAHRSDTGNYRCLAYNYVPGSARDDVTVTVLYPPSDVIITEQPGGKLTCAVQSGSSPDPLFSWIFPNSTITSGNTSTITLLDQPKDKSLYYVCIARNSIGSANATYIQTPPEMIKVGAVSLVVFIVIIVCIVAVILIIILVVCLLRRKYGGKKKSIKMSAEEAFKQYLQYSEPPGVVSVTLSGNKNPQSFSSTSGSNDSTSETRQKSATSPIEIRRALTELDSDNFELRQTDSIQQTTTPLGNTNSFQAMESLPKNSSRDRTLLAAESVTDDGGFGSSSGAKALENRIHSQSATSPQNTDQETVSVSTLPSEVRLRGFTPDISRQTQASALIPHQYFHHEDADIPDYDVPVPMHLRNRGPPIRVLGPGYDPVLYTEPWRSSSPQLDHSSSPHYSTSTFGPRVTEYPTYPLMEAPSLNSIQPVGNSNEGRVRPRSMSLSESSTSSRQSSSFSSNVFEKPRGNQSENQPKKASKDRSPTRTMSPFDSGNDSGRSIQVFVPASKKPSLTLV